jgi:hypothetical protein
LLDTGKSPKDWSNGVNEYKAKGTGRKAQSEKTGTKNCAPHTAFFYLQPSALRL